METLVKMEGIPAKVLEQLMKEGYFKTRTEAFRAGILQLGKEYGLMKISKEVEMELVARKLKQEEEMKRNGERYLTEEEAMRKYRK